MWGWCKAGERAGEEVVEVAGARSSEPGYVAVWTLAITEDLSRTGYKLRYQQTVGDTESDQEAWGACAESSRWCAQWR